MKSGSLAKPDTEKAGTIPECLSSIDLGEILNVSRRAIIKQSAVENWPSEEVPVRGGYQKVFPVADLPPDIRKKVKIHFGEIPAEFAACVPVAFDQERVAKCSRDWDAALPWQRERAQDRLGILKALEAARAASKKGLRAAVDQFVNLYRDKRVIGLDPDVYDRVHKISRSQIYEWDRLFREQGIAGLISHHGHTRGATKMPLDQQKFVLGYVAQNPDLRPAHLARSLQAKFNGKTADRRQIAAFLRSCRENDPATFCFIKSPDEYRSRYQLAWGDGSEKAHRFLHWVEVDSTKADIECSDNRRYTIIGLTDIFSRKCKFLVSSTSNSWAIAAILRATIMDWGLPENLMRDNGQDYVSRQVNELLLGLDIKVTTARPFTPQQKPHVERAIGTLSHMLFEVLPGYVGHNVAERKAIESRKSFAERFMKKGEKIELRLTPTDLQLVINDWVENRYHQREHGGLGKLSPNAKAASVPVRPRRIEDPRSLDILLAPAPLSSVRQVGKKGIKLDNQIYLSPDLVPWAGRSVLVRLDINDAGRIFCFDPETKAFICEAIDRAICGMTVGDKIAAKKRADKRVRERVAALKRLAKESGDPYAEELQAIRESRAQVTNLRVGDPVTDNPFVDAANAAAKAMEEREEKEEDRGNPFLQKGVPPAPLPKNSQLFADPEVASLQAAPEPLDPKIVRFVPRAMDGGQDAHPTRPDFFTSRERFDFLRMEQRLIATSDEDMRWLRTVISDWLDHAEMWAEGWPECDRAWLWTVAPDRFPHYAELKKGAASSAPTLGGQGK